MAWLHWLQQLDLSALHLINQTWSRSWLDPIMARVSDFDSFRYPLLAAILLTFIYGGFRGRLLLLTMGACLVLGDAGVNWALKLAVHRPRPMETVAHLRVVTVSRVTESQPQATSRGRSFTSGHACNNVALAVVAGAIFGRSALWLWPWALLVSYSRIYGAAHYPSDIVGSWIVALGYTVLILYGLETAWQRVAPTLWPNTFRRHPRLYPYVRAAHLTEARKTVTSYAGAAQGVANEST